jgi:hypothetical protein
MSKPHASLSVTTNLLLILVWAAAAALFLFVLEPHAPVALAATGALLGTIGGIMQHLSFIQATQGFSSAASLMDVRRAFKVTRWGSRYIRFLHLSKLILIVLAFVLVRQPFFAILFGYLAGYFSLMFVREIVTLRDTFFLKRLSSNAPETEVGGSEPCR